MFDPDTARLIRNAPHLRGLDMDTLPQLLTRAYSWIASLRIRYAEGPESTSSITQELKQLRRLANTYESYAATLTDADDRRSAAFVAASAHQLLYKAAGLAGRDRDTQHLGRSSISPDVSATLLFLIAGYQADAMEAAATLQKSPTGSVEGAVMRAIANLASGRLPDITDKQYRFRLSDESVAEEEDLATGALYLQCFEGIRELAISLLEGNAAFDSLNRADELFRSVQDLAVRPLDGLTTRSPDDSPLPAFTTFAGPYQLASLLRLASNHLVGAAVSRVPPPTGVPAGGWLRYVCGVARQRPYLWDNHLAAIGQGYLAIGTSAVVTFPTGAGKSTLSELKIAATLEAGKSVVFLVPTRALVWQVYRSLSGAFPGSQVSRTFFSDGAYSEIDIGGDPAISVMTPEKCLTSVATGQLPLDNLGLLVFDECHLVHPRDVQGDRRSLDAMLCLLHVLDTAPKADLLLMSAMVSNAGELSAWIADATDRPCIPLSLEWKPTRQAKGCVVFQRDRIDELENVLSEALQAKKTKGIPAKVRRSLTAAPYGLFGLTHSWERRLNSDNYTLAPLLEGETELSTGSLGLTTNKNKLAAALAARMADLGLKVIVFVQNKEHCLSVSRQIAELTSNSSFSHTSDEKGWILSAAEDLGDETYVLGPQSGVAAPHNSWLLPAERSLNEGAFRRRRGIKVIVATPTLAQGINLPAEAVLIAGDMRFDKIKMQQAQLKAYELLNAAGRAGRAGHASAGLVLMIPDQVVATDEHLRSADGPWGALQRDIFSKKDQCLKVSDPIGLLLDRIQLGHALQHRLLRYFVTRLPLDERESDEEGAARRVLNRSLAAFRAKQQGRSAHFQAGVGYALQVRHKLSELPEQVLWLDRVASTSGIRGRRIRQLHTALLTQPIPASATTEQCVDWLFDWLSTDPGLVAELIEPETLKHCFSKLEWQQLEADSTLISPLLPVLKTRLLKWMRGSTLFEIERELSLPGPPDRYCKRARVFADQVTHGIAQLAGAVAQVARGQIDEGDVEWEMPLALATLVGCIREGLNSPEKLAYRYASDPLTSRVSCHRAVASLDQLVFSGSPTESFEETLARVEQAMDA